jgi:ArsR family transcriptional regulator
MSLPATTFAPPAAPGVLDPGQALKLLAEPTRLRILALLEREELSVGELSRALGMAQSRVSNHLRLLRDAGLLGERRAGTSIFLHLTALVAGGEGDLERLTWWVFHDR